MKMLIFLTVFLFIGGAAYAQGRAVPVGGACGASVALWYDGQCYWAKNNGAQKAVVHLGPWSALLNPNQTFRFVGTGSCFSSYVGPTTADCQ